MDCNQCNEKDARLAALRKCIDDLELKVASREAARETYLEERNTFQAENEKLKDALTEIQRT